MPRLFVARLSPWLRLLLFLRRDRSLGMLLSWLRSGEPLLFRASLIIWSLLFRSLLVSMILLLCPRAGWLWRIRLMRWLLFIKRLVTARGARWRMQGVVRSCLAMAMPMRG